MHWPFTYTYLPLGDDLSDNFSATKIDLKKRAAYFTPRKDHEARQGGGTTTTTTQSTTNTFRHTQKTNNTDGEERGGVVTLALLPR